MFGCPDQSTHRPLFPPETLHVVRVETRRQNFHRNRALERRLPAVENDTEASMTDLVRIVESGRP